jgi:hypothetical protein
MMKARPSSFGCQAAGDKLMRTMLMELRGMPDEFEEPYFGC